MAAMLAVCFSLTVLSSDLAHAVDTTSSNATTVPPATELLIPDSEAWAIHWQATNITQKHSDFIAPYSGTNSLNPHGGMEETTDTTLFLGLRLWSGAEVWLNPEVDQGFGFDNTLGVAGFPSGGAYKIGANTPYLRFPKLFVRQIIALDGTNEAIAAAPNQLAGSQTSNNVTLTVGKFSVVDIFDTNSYAHDPRADFLNWSIFEAGSYDYAADPWGFTFGAAAEWNQDWWTLRAGFFQLSSEPNGKITRINFGENSTNLEVEARHQWLGHPGKIKLLTWINQGRMASYQDAVALGQATNSTPDVALVRRYSSRAGVALNMEQEISSDIGAFARLSANRGDKETYEFSDINQSISAGLSIKGGTWARENDTIGIAVVMNRISGDAQKYFTAGGLGLLIGDGNLNYAPEKIVEMFYSMQFSSTATASVDYQYIANPAYNQDRGPVSVYSLRLHANF
ncbi:Carbohydrate-selective porin, OprB family [Solimicrobium silvestre]|uniref:Carbohydrate-selective porin, OprB family n=2 Tax=Solimicrobium silvestre TaxID=2099400 RepID=A0A2S9GZP2_9BURK|nr:Carbohydrate-selective porin, OprB family [Solimicrobium silvestre]